MNHSTLDSRVDVVLLEFTGRVAMQNYTTMLANALDSKSGIGRVEIVTNNSFNRPRLLKDHIRVRHFDFPESLLKSIVSGTTSSFRMTVLDLLERSNPDVVHVVCEIRSPAPIVYGISRRYPLVLTVHEPDPYVPTLFRRLLLNPIQTMNTVLLGRIVDRVFVHGENSRDELVELGVADSKIRIYPHGSFSPFYTKYDTGEQTDNLVRVLYFGRIFPGKGIEYLLDAAEDMAKSHPEVKFTIAGSGDITPHREQIKDLSNVELINEYVSDSKVAALFKNSDIVVLPYIAGSQSGVIGIAAGYATPVIATNVGNFGEYVRDGETGILVPPKDGKAIATAIKTLSENPSLMRTLGAAAKSDYQKHLSWDETATQAMSEYFSISTEE